MASFDNHLRQARPGERFTYVYIPADLSKPLEERTESSEGGLENDKLSKLLKSEASEVGPNIDIMALTVPTIHSEFKAVSLYQNGNSGADALPVNRRVMGLISACGLKTNGDVHGDAFVSRYADNDDDVWRRIDIKASEIGSDAEWVVAAAVRNKGRSAGGSSLSGVLGQYAAQMHQGQGAHHPSAGAPAGGAGGSGGVAWAGSGDASAAGAGLGGCSWTQTEEEVEVVAPVPAGCAKKDVKVKFLPGRLELSFAGHDAGAGLAGALGGTVDLDGCTWTMDGQKLVVSLEKKEPGKEWPFALTDK